MMPMRPTRPEILLAAATALALASCAPDRPKPLSLEQRTIVDEERRLTYVVHPDWLPMSGTMKCVLDGSFVSVHVYSLIGAEAKFVSGLPESLDPQLDAWARHDYRIEKDKEVGGSTVGGLPARELRFETRAWKDDPAGRLTFWVVRNKSYLYVFRASLESDARPETPAAIRSMLDSVRFLEPPEAPPETEGMATIVVP
jgi:hypothetical protein